MTLWIKYYADLIFILSSTIIFGKVCKTFNMHYVLSTVNYVCYGNGRWGNGSNVTPSHKLAFDEKCFEVIYLTNKEA